MAETQRHEGDLSTPPARNCAPVQHAMNGKEMQPDATRDRVVKQIIGYLANLLCLVGAVYYLFVKQDMTGFLVLIGVATGQIGIWQMIGRNHLRGGTGPLSRSADDNAQ